MRRLSTLLAICVVTATMAAGCGEDDVEIVGGDDGAATTLTTALSRVSPVDGEPLWVYYDDSAALADLLAGREPVAESPRYEELVGFGAVSLAGGRERIGPMGIDLTAAEYAVTVGAPPHQYALVAGGQDTETLAAELTEHGWSAEGDELVAPAPGQVDGDLAQYTLWLAKVAIDDGELVYGGAGADLSLVDGSDGGLMADARVASIAGCLGDVAAALINTPELPDVSPVLGLGVRTPADADERPEVVVCTSWESEDAAAAYAERATGDLTDGSTPDGLPYSELFDPAEAVTDGDLASWRTGTDQAMTIFTVFARGGIPGLALV